MAAIKQKNGKWMARFNLNKIKTQKGGFRTKAEAEAYEQSRISAGKSWRDTIDTNFRTMRIKELCTHYRKHLLKTRSTESEYIVDRVEKQFGDIIIGKLTPSDCRQWIDKLFETLAIGSVKLHLTYFKAIINYAIKTELINENPIQSVSYSKVFRKAGVRNEVILPDQWPEFQKLFTNHRWYIKGIAMMLWHTGMRIGEVLNLKWENVDLSFGTISISPEDVKEGSQRTMGIEKELLDLLQEIKSCNNKKGAKSKDHVFGITKNLPLSYQTFYQVWKKAVKDTPFSKFNIHDKRHSYVTRKRREGHNREIIKVQTGHKTNIMFERYDDIQKDEVIDLSGTNKEKESIIENDVKMLMTKCHEHSISLSTIHTVIRKNLFKS